MVESSPAYAGAPGEYYEVQLPSVPRVRQRQHDLAPCIRRPTASCSPRRPAKTYYVGVMPRRAPAQEVDSLESAVEERIAFRAERASRYASDRCFPALTTEQLLPQWQGEVEEKSSLLKPTLEPWISGPTHVLWVLWVL